jgi:gamma-glutamyltranspeptidase/glutathione hydrolase
LNVIDHGMSLQEAVEAPRIWTQGQNLELEPGIDGKVEEVLSRFGHELERVDRVAGGMNGIQFSPDGLIHGAACWRADGSPVGLSGGPAIFSGSNPMFTI